MATREIIDILSVTGGVPRYLEEINPSLSAAENIKRLCFTPNGILRTDFDDMFNDVITHQRSFAGRVLRTLTDGPRTISEISAMLSTERGGRVSDTISRLLEAGFIASDVGKDPETNEMKTDLSPNATPAGNAWTRPANTPFSTPSGNQVWHLGPHGDLATTNATSQNCARIRKRVRAPRPHLTNHTRANLPAP